MRLRSIPIVRFYTHLLLVVLPASFSATFMSADVAAATKTEHIGPALVNSGQLDSEQVDSGQVHSGQMQAGQIQAGQIKVGQTTATSDSALNEALTNQPTQTWDPSHFKQRLVTFLTKQLKQFHPDARGTFEPRTLHPAIRSKPCSQYTFHLSQQNWRGNLPVQVKCLKPNWSFYVTVPANIELPGLTAKRLIHRNEPLNPQDVELRFFPGHQLRQNILTDPQDVVHKSPRANLRPGLPIYAHQLTASNLVNKGDVVTIHAIIGNATVSSTGTAMQNGKIGQQISIRNGHSGRIIKSWVWYAGVVGNRPADPRG